MSEDTLTLRLRNTVDAIAPADEAAATWLLERQFPLDSSFFVGLAISELVSNCIKYGYDDHEEHTISILLSVAGHILTMVVIDDGHAFDPLAVSPPDLSAKLEAQPTGGRGIFLLRQLADDVRYERRDGANRVTLIKRLL